MIKKQRVDCFKRDELEIVNNDTLSSNGDFMGELEIKTTCSDDCAAKGICITICNKLLHRNYIGAGVLLNDLTQAMVKN